MVEDISASFLLAGVRSLAVASVSLTAAVALLLHRRRVWLWPLTALALAMSISIGIRLFKPELWDYNVEILQNCLCALLASVFCLKAVRHDSLSMANLGATMCLGFGILLAPTGDHSAYREISILDLLIAILMLSTWKLLGMGASKGLVEVAADRLRAVFAVRALYYASFEVGLTVAWWVGLASTVAYCWALFGIAQCAFSDPREACQGGHSHESGRFQLL